jgi:DUF1680 family protein
MTQASNVSRRKFLAGAAAISAPALASEAAPRQTATLPNPKTPPASGVLSPIDLRQVKLAGEFGRRVDQIIEANILLIDVDSTFLHDFRRRGTGGYLGFGKFIDACVRLAAGTGDARMLAFKKKVISDLIATQEPGGYIGTIADPHSRVKALWDLHENSYIIWALVSDYQFFGETASLEAARRMADYLLGLFAANPALRPDTMNGVVTFWGSSLGFDRALLALSRSTGNPKYREFVVDFLKLGDYNPEIHCGPTSLANHAYTYMGHSLAQLDLYRETGDPRLLRATRRAVGFMRKDNGMLVTGSCSEGECWHDTQSGLQNTSETCMAAYLARIMDAMLQLEGASLYGDIMERDIYNALFAATSPDGHRSRYFTPFDGKRTYDLHGNRFCCANNNKRFLADLRGWMYYRTADGVAVNLYNASTASMKVAKDVGVRIEQQTDYPTSGNVLLKIDPSEPASFAVKLRIPRWCDTAAVSVNGGTPTHAPGGDFYALRRTWKPGDAIELEMPMQWRLVRGRRSQAGRAAILRGPVIFTLNPARNPTISGRAAFEPRQLMIHPLELEAPVPDNSVRLGGVSCTVTAWPPGPFHFWPFIPRVPLVLTEYPDAGGQAIYFMVPDEYAASIVEDELIDRPV